MRVEALDHALDRGLLERAWGDRIDVLAAHVLRDLVEELVLRAGGHRLIGWSRRGRRASGRAAQQHEAGTDGDAGQHGKDGSDSVGQLSRAEKGHGPDITRRGWR